MSVDVDVVVFFPVGVNAASTVTFSLVAPRSSFLPFGVTAIFNVPTPALWKTNVTLATRYFLPWIDVYQEITRRPDEGAVAENE